MISYDELVQYLDYNPETGIFTHRNSGRRVKAGDVAGTDCNGYIRIKYKSKSYYAHRLAWLYMTKNPITHFIDHIDRNTSNNAWSNLREATHADNMKNRSIRKDNTTGYRGVMRRGKMFIAKLKKDGKVIYLGTYATPDQASIAYETAAKEIHGEFYSTVY